MYEVIAGEYIGNMGVFFSSNYDLRLKSLTDFLKEELLKFNACLHVPYKFTKKHEKVNFSEFAIIDDIGDLPRFVFKDEKDLLLFVLKWG